MSTEIAPLLACSMPSGCDGFMSGGTHSKIEKITNKRLGTGCSITKSHLVLTVTFLLTLTLQYSNTPNGWALIWIDLPVCIVRFSMLSLSRVRLFSEVLLGCGNGPGYK